MTKYKRVLLKLSGECFLPKGEKRGVSFVSAKWLARELIKAHKVGVEIAIVIGGGNLMRGAVASKKENVDQKTSDIMGMIATSMNGLALKAAFSSEGVDSVVMNAFQIGDYIEAFSEENAKRYLGQKKVLILTGGTGKPFCTTDSGASMRAIAIKANALLKGTKVDGIYDSDPVKEADAKRFESITYDEVLDKKLGIMDLAAVRQCRDNEIPIVVFDTFRDGNLEKVIKGENIGTVVYG